MGHRMLGAAMPMMRAEEAEAVDREVARVLKRMIMV